jgi:hypothetical protein
MKRAFDEHPEVDCVGGKVLPQWRVEPPRWLTCDHWSALALVDYGDEPFYVNVDNRIGLIGANLAFRANVFKEIGLFLPELQRVRNSIGSMEDHQYLDRFWRTGKQGLYLPDLIVTGEVAFERMTKDYHRRWHAGHGKFYAIMRAEEVERSLTGRIYDVPAHLYRQAIRDATAWLKHLLRGDRDHAFKHELRLRFFCGYFHRRRQDFLATRQHGIASEVAALIRSLVTRKGHRNTPGPTG